MASRAAVARHVLWLTLKDAPRRSFASTACALAEAGTGGRASSRSSVSTNGLAARSAALREGAQSWPQISLPAVTASTTVQPVPAQQASPVTPYDTVPSVDVLLALPPAEAFPSVRAFAAQPYPKTIPKLHVFVSDLTRLVDHLSPRGSWSSVTWGEKFALLSLWARWLGAVGMLMRVDALPKPGKYGAYYAATRFTPLLHAILVQPDIQHAKSQTSAYKNWRRWRAREGERKRVLAVLSRLRATFQFMAELGVRPTALQLQLVLQNIPPDVLLSRTLSPFLGGEKSEALANASRSLERLLNPQAGATKEETFETTSQPNNRKHATTDERNIILAATDVILRQLEVAYLTKRQAASNWEQARQTMRPYLLSQVDGYTARFGEAIRTGDTVLPAKFEAVALFHLLRNALLASRTSQPRKEMVHGRDLGDPLELLRLLLGVGSDITEAPNPLRTPTTERRVNSAIIRVTHAPLFHDKFTGVLDVLRLLVGEEVGDTTAGSTDEHAEGKSSRQFQSRILPAPPLPLQTAIYIAGAAHEPGHLVKIVPFLRKLQVEPAGEEVLDGYFGTSGEKRKVPSRLLLLARAADYEKLGKGVEEETRQLFRSWGSRV